jgi:AcrR family transcriptional regulator
MQYLSQRLAAEPARTRDGERPRGVLVTGQRERILAATEELIAEKGCSGTTIEGIVERARVSSVTFYEHFRNKEECFVAAFERAVAETREGLSRATAAETAWPEQVRAGLAALLAAIESEPARARMCLVEAQMGGRELREAYEATLAEAAATLREGRTLASAPRELASTLEEANVGGLAWLLRERLEFGGGGSVRELLPRMSEIALAPYLDDGSTLPAPAAVDG